LYKERYREEKIMDKNRKENVLYKLIEIKNKKVENFLSIYLDK